MKNVTKLPTTEVFREPIPGLLLSHVWAVKYVSGTKPGHWLVQWDMSPERIIFAFSPDKNLFFTAENAAQSVSDIFRKDMEIVTEVVKAG